MNIGGGDEYDGRTRTSDNAPGALEGGRTATRTRLPGSETGGSGGRPPTRPGRNLITVVAVIVLLIAAIAFANRGGEGGDNAGDSTDDSPRTGSGPHPTAPTGEKPVKNPTAGIPSDFPHTEQGAQSAAANYVVALNGPDMYTAATRKKVIKSVYAPDVAAERQADVEKAYGNPEFLAKVGLDEDGKPPKGSTFVARAMPVGAKAVDYAHDKARVSVWYSALFGLAGEESKHPVAESWYTNSFDLTWTNGDWKIRNVKQKDGPTPVGRDQAASPADEMADAVDGFGGFTYAR